MDNASLIKLISHCKRCIHWQVAWRTRDQVAQQPRVQYLATFMSLSAWVSIYLMRSLPVLSRSRSESIGNRRLSISTVVCPRRRKSSGRGARKKQTRGSEKRNSLLQKRKASSQSHRSLNGQLENVEGLSKRVNQSTFIPIMIQSTIVGHLKSESCFFCQW